jgi:DNA-binding transcriptional LysR family regulator
MDLRRLRYFIAVADERHFGRAAAHLGIAQPPLSRQIQALEEELGVSLFDRSRRQIELTTAGGVLVTHARALLDAAERAALETQRAGRGEFGRLVIGYPSSIAYSGLTEILRAYRARFPGVELQLHEGAPQAVVDALNARRMDVGFVRGPLEEPALRNELVLDEPLLVAMADQHPLRGRGPMRLEALAQEPFVLFPRERSPWFFDLVLRLCRDAGFEPRVAQQAPAIDVVSLVAVGLGVAILPASWRGLRREGIVFRGIVGDPRTQLLLCWPKGEIAPVTTRFIETVRSVGVSH